MKAYIWYVECLKNCCDAVDRTYYDAIFHKRGNILYEAGALFSLTCAMSPPLLHFFILILFYLGLECAYKLFVR